MNLNFNPEESATITGDVFAKSVVLEITSEEGGLVHFIREDKVISLMERCTARLITENKLTITSGNEGYFKRIFEEYDTTTNSPMVDGEQLPGLHQGQVQSNGQIYEGNDRAGDGVSNASQRPGGS